jgi:hypothetical protein
MLRCLPIAVLGILFLACQAPATTLERLTVEEMTAKSHLIVRATVGGQTVEQRGSIVYTVYSLKVSETLKGEPSPTVQVSVPGGTIGRVRQSYAGTPTLQSGAEYVVFIWKGKTGILHIIGLSQGLFDLKVNAVGETVLTRGVLDAELVDKNGKQVQSQSVVLTLDSLRRTARTAGAAVR